MTDPKQPVMTTSKEPATPEDSYPSDRKVPNAQERKIEPELIYTGGKPGEAPRPGGNVSLPLREATPKPSATNDKPALATKLDG